MPNIRMSRINSDIQKYVATIIDNQVEHPNLHGVMVTVLRVDTTPDLLNCKIFVSALGGEIKEVVKALNFSSRFIRSELGKRIRLKTIPELSFMQDGSYFYDQHMNELFDSIKGDLNE